MLLFFSNITYTSSLDNLHQPTLPFSNCRQRKGSLHGTIHLETPGSSSLLSDSPQLLSIHPHFCAQHDAVIEKWVDVTSSHEAAACWTGKNAAWKPQTDTKVTGLFGNGGALFARCLFVWPGLLWQQKTWYGGFIQHILSYQGIFHPACIARGEQTHEIQLLPVCPTELLDNPGGFGDIPAFLSYDILGAMRWLVNWWWHVSQAPFHLLHLSFLGTSSLFTSVLRCRRKFSLLRTTSGQYLCFSYSKHC